MRRTAEDRQGRPPLLSRRPRIDRQDVGSRVRVANPVDQYRALISLIDRGLLSPQEFARQASRIGQD